MDDNFLSNENWLWRFLFCAIKNPITSNNFYYFDKNSDTLFAYQICEGKILPLSGFKLDYNLLKNSKSNIIELPKISTLEKKEFIRNYAMSANIEIANLLLSKIDMFTDSDLFDYDIIVFPSRKDRYLYGLEFEKFISSKILTLYFCLGINDNSKCF